MSAQATTPTFLVPGPLISDTGHALIEWEGDGVTTLEMAPGALFSNPHALYRGEGSSFFLSGLSDGEYHLRLRDESGGFSDPILLTVAHQSLERALWLTLIGALITLSLVLTILRGARHG